MKTKWHSKYEYPVEKQGIIMFCQHNGEHCITYEVSPDNVEASADNKDAFDWLVNFHKCIGWCYENELLDEIKETLETI